MRIVDIRECAVPLKSNIRNSSFDFSEMTTSVVAVVTDVMRDGKPVVGFAFNSTGRYACGAQMRARFIPRILAADPATLLDDAGENLDPAKILACMMQREKSGGHSERSIAIGTIEVAVWDAVAKIAGKPLHRLLAERYNGGKVADESVLLCRRRLVLAGPDRQGPAGRDAPPSRRRLHHGEDEGRRHARSTRTCAGWRRSKASCPPARSSRSTPIRNSHATRRSPMRSALAPFRLRWFEEPCDPLDFALLAEIASRL